MKEPSLWHADKQLTVTSWSDDQVAVVNLHDGFLFLTAAKQPVKSQSCLSKCLELAMQEIAALRRTARLYETTASEPRTLVVY